MNVYLRAIGFSNFDNKKELNDFFIKNLEEKYLVANVVTDTRIVGQYNIGVTQNAGVAFIGDKSDNNQLFCDYYFPYAISHTPFRVDECMVRRYRDRDAYLGLIDDAPLGFSLVFYMTNPVLYNSFLRSGKEYYVKNIYLAGLSLSGVVILPMEGTKENIIPANNNSIINSEYGTNNQPTIEQDASNNEVQPTNNKYVNFNTLDIKENLLKHPLGEKELAQRKMEQLDSLLDNLIVRSQNDDLFSIVHTTIVPADSLECDEYDVIGEILSVNQKINVWTDEIIWDLKLKSLDIVYNVFINSSDLVGDPQVGRRFKGQIWLQGEIEFLEKKKRQSKKSQI